MAGNVVSLKNFRTLRECQKLFAGYKDNISKLPRVDLMEEVQRYQKEAISYPHHLLTVVKGEILMSIVKKVAITEDLKNFADKEEIRLKTEVERRLYEEFA